ncbi:DUF6774 domain-containing protein [Flavonifractor sp. AGMB03687]|uniref:DUF6774 domain-containing protein n=1 Tax=Flavonifractor sp. AGMB03687 TaxID=2785133 RepID=UPI001AE02176|nr:DUF6774 domain-containing protein [Flavonifractor sp. AGMB03687]
MRPVYTPPSGETLLAAAALAGAQLAKNRSAEELAVLSAFFCTLGDGLALIAARRTMDEACKASVNPIDNGPEIA